MPTLILNRASAVAPYPGVDTASAAPSPIKRSTSSNASTKPAASGVTPSYDAGAMRTTRLPACLNSGDVARSTEPMAVANDTSVGGTSSCSKLPDMESLPPMEPIPRSTCAISAPSTAAAGLPQRSGSSRSFSKYSWNVRYMSLWKKPAATRRATLSTTAMYEPVNWFASVR